MRVTQVNVVSRSAIGSGISGFFGFAVAVIILSFWVTVILWAIPIIAFIVLVVYLVSLTKPELNKDYVVPLQSSARVTTRGRIEVQDDVPRGYTTRIEDVL